MQILEVGTELLNPWTWTGIGLLALFGLFARAEIQKRKAAAGPYILAYWIAVTFYSTFVAIALPNPRAAEKWVPLAGYLAFTTAVLGIGVFLHWRVVRRSGG